jgi:hypothetical protein
VAVGVSRLSIAQSGEIEEDAARLKGDLMLEE